MAILMLSLTGIPPTVGFFAKLYVLLAAVEAGLAWLAVIIVLNAALAAFYYLRVIVYMYMRDPEPQPAPLDTSPLGSVALALSIVGVIALGVFPGAVLGVLQRALPLQHRPARIVVGRELGEDGPEVDLAIAQRPEPARPVDPALVAAVDA